MMKKFVRVLAVVLVLMLATCSVALADKKGNNGNNGNDVMKYVRNLVKDTNKKIHDAVQAARATAVDDTAELIAYAEKLSAQTIDEAAKLGVALECEYTTYVVDGKKISVDPLKVINKK